ncbi:MAG: TAT-variant-translocated molybdopterin oxidoreductase [Candidatus Latescibacterota bacterium]
MAPRRELDVAQVRARLQGAAGPAYWRSLDELAQTEEFALMVQREFPESASEWHDPLSRRAFLQLMGASLALGGLTSCTIQPQEAIVAQVHAAEQVLPGRPLFYATAHTHGGVGTGVLVESHMGRPTKVEGNPLHPASLGATDAIAQASVLELYDPDRLQTVVNAGRMSTWEAFLRDLDLVLGTQAASGGAGLRVLTGGLSSPTLLAQLQSLLRVFPRARWHQYEAVNQDAALAGALLAFGQAVNTWYDVARAQVILSLDADFAGQGPGSVRYARDLMAGRRTRDGRQEMNRLYVVEPIPTCTGSVADHRLALSTDQIEHFALRLAAELGVDLPWGAVPQRDLPPRAAAWLEPLARDLRRAGEAGLVVAGMDQAPAVHALAHAMSAALGNAGSTVHYTAPLDGAPVSHVESLAELAADLRAGQVEILLIVGGNPVYDAPADLQFAQVLQQAGRRMHLTLHANETSELCHWVLPQSHYLEAWSDVRAYDGLVTIVQPLIEPLYGTRSAHEVLAAFVGQAGRSGHDIVGEHWTGQHPGPDFEAFWRQSLHDGVVPDTRLPELQPALRRPVVLPPEAFLPHAQDELEIVFRPDPHVWDGRYANSGWLQELPRPITRLTWDNALLLSPATAQRLGVRNEDVVDATVGQATVRGPVWIVPGQAPGVVGAQLGYGRRLAGRVGNGVGFDAYPVRTSSTMGRASGLVVTPTSRTSRLAATQQHHSMEGRSLVRQGTLAQFGQNPRFAQELGPDPPADLTLYPRYAYPGAAWGMVIDLNACLGCGACTVACQAENNIPVVGKEQVLRNREMHWIRVDRYYKGELDDPAILHQPVPCMHCETAPCEVVCPVAATVHGAEGLNEMVYNRCVGTRYCENNCPYKVRRFNFLLYTNHQSDTFRMQRNPDVTVRDRGVMEKCTYCVQRINTARIDAKRAGRPVADGEVVTACQQACPTRAIVFGDINDPASEVSQARQSPLHYGLLSELNTRPRTTYLAALRNPNPEIAEG